VGCCCTLTGTGAALAVVLTLGACIALLGWRDRSLVAVNGFVVLYYGIIVSQSRYVQA